MPELRLRSVTARWHPHRPVAGHDEARPISFKAAPGTWVSIVGPNGVGKSTLLHAIAGTVPFVSGSIELGPFALSPADPGARFSLGVQFVRQRSAFGEERMPLQDGRDLAFARRPALFNEQAQNNLLTELSGAGWPISGALITPRLLDLVTAMFTVPRVLLLDEIRPAFSQARPANTDPASLYSMIRQQLPLSIVLFSDHDVDVAIAAADHILWLPQDGAPQYFSIRETSQVELLRTSVGPRSERKGAASNPMEALWGCLEPEQSTRYQVRMALLSRGLNRSEETDLLNDFIFLGEERPAGTLSGGQSVVLLWVLIELSGLDRLPDDLTQHLDPSLLTKLSRWRQRLQEKHNHEG